MKKVPVSASFLLASAMLFLQACVSEPKARTGDEMYRSAFSKNTLKILTQMHESDPERIEATFGTASIPKLVSLMTECHMQAMTEYSFSLQSTAYDAVASGSSYLEAKQAFDMALATEGMAGGEREKDVKRMFARAGERGARCLSGLRGGGTSSP